MRIWLSSLSLSKKFQKRLSYSIFLMVWKIYGFKVLTFTVYHDAIVKMINLAPPYLVKHMEYCIDQREKNYSKWNFEQEKHSECFSAWSENLYFATMGEIPIKWGLMPLSCHALNLRHPIYYILSMLNYQLFLYSGLNV